jgi:PiT family inorganic phosphate transporter
VDLALIVIVVIVALAFDFTNGFHDTANAIATSVSTRALSPRLAVIVAAAANLAGAFVTTAVAKNVGSGIIDTALTTTVVVLAALLGAIAWNLLTWWLGLPSSSSHALIGGLVGAALAKSGSEGVQWDGLLHKVVIPALVAPPIAFASAFALLIAIFWIFVRVTPGLAKRGFRLGQLASGTFVAFAHGANDAQKTMGVIALALFAYGSIDTFYIPTWVKVSAGLAIAAGTYAGGWRIMRTLGQRLYKIEPPAGFSAQATAGATIYVATHLGYPLSTTHVISGAVLGAGSTRRASAVRWGIAGNIVVAWVLTLPAAALMAAASTGRSRRSFSPYRRTPAWPGGATSREVARL